MLIFLKQLIIFQIFFAPVHPTHYTLNRADVDMGEFMYQHNVRLSKIGRRLYKITSSEGERTFRTWNFVTMLGQMVEFDTYDSNSRIRCEFEDLTAAQDFFHDMKRSIYPEIGFSLISTEIVLDKNLYTVLTGGNLFVELQNRFYILSEIDNAVMMVFSCGLFNVSSVLTGGRMLLVVQIYEIEVEHILMMDFVLTFTDDIKARHFHHYIKKEISCTNNIIPVVIPDHVQP